MGRQIIKQPNGKFAYWSSIVDNFILLNTTPKKIIEFRIQEETTQIKEDINEIISKLNQGKKPYFQFTNSWEDCLETIQDIHGKEKITEIMKLINHINTKKI